MCWPTIARLGQGISEFRLTRWSCFRILFRIPPVIITGLGAGGLFNGGEMGGRRKDKGGGRRYARIVRVWFRWWEVAVISFYYLSIQSMRTQTTLSFNTVNFGPLLPINLSHNTVTIKV